MRRLIALAIASALLLGVSYAWGASLTTVLAGGDTLAVTCAGTKLQISRQDSTHAALTCKGTTTSTTSSSTTSTTAPTTTTTTGTGGFPDASNTGIPPGTVLTTISGSFTIDQAYANTLPGSGTAADPYIFENKKVTGMLVVDVDYVVVRRVRALGNGSYGIWSPADHTTVEDSDIGPDSGGVDNALSFENDSVALRNNVHNGEVGIKFRSRNLIEDNYVHGLWQVSGSHNGGIHAPQGDANTIRHNTVDGLTIPSGGRNHNGISIYDELTGSSTGLLVENNYITHSGYHVYLAVGSAIVRNNVLTTDFEWGTFFNAIGGTQGGGNVNENGQVVAP